MVGVALAAPAGCKRQTVMPASVTRPARMASPTSDDVEKEKRAQLMAELNPIDKLEDPKTQVTPDGEVWTRYSNGLMIHTLKPSSDGLPPQLGQMVKVTYVGTFPGNKSVFDHKDADDPLTFRLGSKSMVKGFNQGISTMHAGEKRRIFVPPDLGYGTAGTMQVPGNTAMIFEVELLDISGQGVEYKLDDLPLAQPLGPPAPAHAAASTTAPASAPGR
jgi:FKBP-type peptidyl-prolyl cis-trans isomerase